MESIFKRSYGFILTTKLQNHGTNIYYNWKEHTKSSKCDGHKKLVLFYQSDPKYWTLTDDIHYT